MHTFGPDLAQRGRMNMNSLVIVADAARARLFRTAATTCTEAPVELIEIGSLNASETPDRSLGKEGEPESRGAEAAPVDALPRFANRIAVRAAQFAHYHFCNPFIVVSDEPVSAALLRELAHELPNAHVRRVTADVAQLPPRDLMQELQERAAFTPLPARTPGRIDL